MVSNPMVPLVSWWQEKRSLRRTPPPVASRSGLQKKMRRYSPPVQSHLESALRSRELAGAVGDAFGRALGGISPWSRTADAGAALAEFPPRELAEIYREPGRGAFPTIVLGGFVPDSTEAVHCQRRLLRRFGDVYYVNYPKTGLDRTLLFAQLRDLIAALRRRGERPVLFGVSFGCGLIAEFLTEERARHLRGAAAGVAGLVWVSPVLSVEDLIGADGKDRTLVGRVCLPMVEAADVSQVEASVRNGRRFFGKLFTAGGQNREAMRRLRWRKQGEFLKERILETVRDITTEGARQRLDLLRRKCPIRDNAWSGPLCEAPAITLFAESEAAVLAPSAPARAVLEQRPGSILPRGEVVVVESGDPGDAVQHASLIFHHRYYNPPLERFYLGLAATDSGRPRNRFELRTFAGPWRSLGGLRSAG